MFMVFVWVFVNIGGGVLQGQVPFVATHLTADIDDSDVVIPVASTEGFPDPGVIVIGDERIAYPDVTAIQFQGTFARPLTRGAQDTTAESHSDGDRVYTVQGSMLNSSMQYNIATIADASGLQGFISGTLALFQLIGSFFTLPIAFFGTDLEILAILWAVLTLGIFVAIVISMAGGRRV